MADATLFDLLSSAIADVRAGHTPPGSVLKLLLSKALGIGILTFACIVKVPQIVTVGKSKSAEGLAPISFELEQLGLCIHTAYGVLLGLPFTVYGEAAIICLQNTFLLAQIYWYAKTPVWRSATTALGLAVGISAVLMGHVTQDIIKSAYDLNNVIFLAARVPQIYQNYQRGGTGQLSTTTAFANFAGCIARIFTSIQEGGGVAMVRGYILGTLLNGTIFFQIVYYSWTARHRKKTPATKKQI